METIRYYIWVRINTIAPKPLSIHCNLLDWILSYMVDKEVVKDEENGV